MGLPGGIASKSLKRSDQVIHKTYSPQEPQPGEVTSKPTHMTLWGDMEPWQRLLRGPTSQDRHQCTDAEKVTMHTCCVMVSSKMQTFYLSRKIVTTESKQLKTATGSP